MHTKDLVLHNSRNWQTVKAINKRLPELDIIPPLAFVVKPIDSVYRGTFVISSQDKEVLGVFDLIS